MLLVRAVRAVLARRALCWLTMCETGKEEYWCFVCYQGHHITAVHVGAVLATCG